MKLSKIYSNKEFKPITFNPDLNIILGRVKKPKDKNSDSHNLGKTTLIDVIDFMALKDIGADHFLLKYKNKFIDYDFYLEIQLNTGGYVTIRRSVTRPSKISFKLHSERQQDFRGTTIWDDENVPIKKAQKKLNDLLAFDVLKGIKYRNLISYFLRTQGDYSDVFQLHKFNRSNDIDWKPPVFSLLGFDGSSVEKKYELENELDEHNSLVEKLSQQSAVKSEESDKINGLIQLKSDEKSQIEKQLDDFNFYSKEREINGELVEEIEKEIGSLNTKEYDIDYEISKIKESLQTKINFDIKATKKVFEEARIYFPDQLVKNYEDLISFNKKVLDERSVYLNERLDQLVSEQKETRNLLSEKNKKRSEFLSLLKDADSFKKFKTYQKDVVKLEAEIFSLKKQIETIKSISTLGDTKKILLDEIAVVEKQIEGQIAESNELYVNIRRSFSQIVKEMINQPALISIKINKNKNIEFNADIQALGSGEITAGGRGNSYKKLLCMAFDLSLLINYSDNSFFRFVYHDGALEALDDRKKIKFLDYIREVNQTYGIQYILTAIEHDLPRDENDKRIQFKKGEVILELTDEGDGGKLFEQSF